MSAYPSAFVKDGKGGQLPMPLFITQQGMDTLAHEFVVQADDLFRFPSAGEPTHFRKGEIGDWRNHFSAEQSERMDQLYREKMHGSQL